MSKYGGPETDRLGSFRYRSPSGPVRTSALPCMIMLASTVGGSSSWGIPE
jgi:hypothetical protein